MSDTTSNQEKITNNVDNESEKEHYYSNKIATNYEKYFADNGESLNGTLSPIKKVDVKPTDGARYVISREIPK
jgi:hypothetical protein